MPKIETVLLYHPESGKRLRVNVGPTEEKFRKNGYIDAPKEEEKKETSDPAPVSKEVSRSADETPEPEDSQTDSEEEQEDVVPETAGPPPDKISEEDLPKKQKAELIAYADARFGVKIPTNFAKKDIIARINNLEETQSAAMAGGGGGPGQ